jgi:surface polysaccharide O-acyltransferase-like enzyme
MSTRTSTPASPRMVWMDQLRGTAILLVIAFHAASILSRFGAVLPGPVWDVLSFFAPFRMPTLMFLSGMLLSRSIAKPTPEYISGKWRGILWPYLIWSFAFLFISGQTDPYILGRVLYNPPTYLWYLWFLFLYYLIFWIANRAAVPVGLIILLGFVMAFGPEKFRIGRFGFLIIFFAAGHLFTLYGHRWLTASRVRWTALIAGVVALVGGVLSASGVKVQYEPLYIAIPFAGLTWCVLTFRGLSLGRTGALLAYVGRDSIVFYMTHFIAIWVVCWWADRLGFANPNLTYVLCMACAIAVGLLLTWLRSRLNLVDALFQFPKVRLPAPRVGSAETRAAELGKGAD